MNENNAKIKEKNAGIAVVNVIKDVARFWKTMQTASKYVCPNKQRELTISIMKVNSTQVMKTPTDSLLILFSRVSILRHKIKQLTNSITSRCAQTKMTRQRG